METLTVVLGFSVFLTTAAAKPSLIRTDKAAEMLSCPCWDVNDLNVVTAENQASQLGHFYKSSCVRSEDHGSVMLRTAHESVHERKRKWEYESDTIADATFAVFSSKDGVRGGTCSSFQIGGVGVIDKRNLSDEQAVLCISQIAARCNAIKTPLFTIDMQTLCPCWDVGDLHVVTAENVVDGALTTVELDTGVVAHNQGLPQLFDTWQADDLEAVSDREEKELTCVLDENDPDLSFIRIRTEVSGMDGNTVEGTIRFVVNMRDLQCAKGVSVMNLFEVAVPTDITAQQANVCASQIEARLNAIQTRESTLGTGQS